MTEHTTPLERVILTHYWTTPGPYKDGSENWTELESALINKFLERGLLLRVLVAGVWVGDIVANDDAMRLYMAALAAVPLPVQRWVIPGEPVPE